MKKLTNSCWFSWQPLVQSQNSSWNPLVFIKTYFRKSLETLRKNMQKNGWPLQGLFDKSRLDTSTNGLKQAHKPTGNTLENLFSRQSEFKNYFLILNKSFVSNELHAWKWYFTEQNSTYAKSAIDQYSGVYLYIGKYPPPPPRVREYQRREKGESVKEKGRKGKVKGRKGKEIEQRGKKMRKWEVKG